MGYGFQRAIVSKEIMGPHVRVLRESMETARYLCKGARVSELIEDQLDYLVYSSCET